MCLILPARLKLVSEHEYGNGTAIFTRDAILRRTFAEKFKWEWLVSMYQSLCRSPYHSFGGWKRSIFSDIDMHGPEGVRFYTKLKTITATLAR